MPSASTASWPGEDLLHQRLPAGHEVDVGQAHGLCGRGLDVDDGVGPRPDPRGRLGVAAAGSGPTEQHRRAGPGLHVAANAHSTTTRAGSTPRRRHTCACPSRSGPRGSNRAPHRARGIPTPAATSRAPGCPAPLARWTGRSPGAGVLILGQPGRGTRHHRRLPDAGSVIETDRSGAASSLSRRLRIGDVMAPPRRGHELGGRRERANNQGVWIWRHPSTCFPAGESGGSVCHQSGTPVDTSGSCRAR